MLFMPDASTRLAALRTGKIALLRNLSGHQAETLQRTNPELVMTSGIYKRSTGSYAMDVRKPPFSDIRVRTAMQLAIDLETINKTLYNGLAVLHKPDGGRMGSATAYVSLLAAVGGGVQR